MKKDKKIGTLPSLMSASADAVPAIFKDMSLFDNQQEVVLHTAACLFGCLHWRAACAALACAALHLWIHSTFQMQRRADGGRKPDGRVAAAALMRTIISQLS